MAFLRGTGSCENSNAPKYFRPSWVATTFSIPKGRKRFYCHPIGGDLVANISTPLVTGIIASSGHVWRIKD